MSSFSQIMNHRSEARRIYNQRRKISQLELNNKKLEQEMNYYKKQSYNYKSRIDKTLIYLGKCDWNDKYCFENIINILKGSV